MSTSRSLSLFMPTWSQQKKRTESIRSSTSSTVIHSPSWSNMSFDQSSLYKSSIEGEDKKRKRQREKLQSTIHGFSNILLLSLNDCSLGFYRISDHINRKVPRIVETRKRLNQSSKKVDVAISDIQDVRKNVCDIERIESFYNINNMIKRSIQILNNSNKKMMN